MRKQHGFTLVEVTIILLVLVILSTIMLPQLGNFNRLARFVKAREDVGALCSVMKKMLDETLQGAFYQNPRTNTGPIGLLYGPGRVPDAGAAVSGEGNGVAPSEGHWRWGAAGSADAAPALLLGPGGFAENTDGTPALQQLFHAGRLEDHLIRNVPAGGAFAAASSYPNPVQDPVEHSHGSTGVGAYFGWRGPYVDWLSADPWGNRYSVNTFALYSPSASNSNDDIFSSAVAVHSAGANERVDTYFNQPAGGGVIQTDAGWHFGVDDIGCILSAGGPM